MTLMTYDLSDDLQISLRRTDDGRVVMSVWDDRLEERRCTWTRRWTRADGSGSMTEREDHILASAVIVLGATVISILAAICTPGGIVAGASAWLAGIAWAWTEVSCSR